METAEEQEIGVMPRREKQDDWGQEDDEDVGKGKKKRKEWERKERGTEGEDGEAGDQRPPWADHGPRR
jgi:hypothetical protein